MFKNLPQYHFERDKFCEALFKFVNEDEFTEIVSSYDFVTSSFLFRRVGDEFYIIHLDSGIMINWYKHLGRTNTCNRKDFTYDNLLCFFKMFTDEWREEIHVDKVKRTYPVSSEGIDFNSMYPKLIANSIYGLTLKPENKMTFNINDLPKETKQ